MHGPVHIKACSDLAYQVGINELCTSKAAPPTRGGRFTDGQTEASPIGLTGKSRNVAIIPRVGEQRLFTVQNGTGRAQRPRLELAPEAPPVGYIVVMSLPVCERFIFFKNKIVHRCLTSLSLVEGVCEQSRISAAS